MNVTNPKIWGPPLWDILHYLTFQYNPKDAKKIERIFTFHLTNLMPCKHCRIHYRKYIKAHPIQLQSRESLSRWLVKIHNKTNAQLGKPHYDYAKAQVRYTSYSSQSRVRESFIKWTAIMRPNITTGSLNVQRSYSAFVSFLFNNA